MLFAVYFIYAKDALISRVAYLAQIKCCDKKKHTTNMKYCYLKLSQRNSVVLLLCTFQIKFIFHESIFIVRYLHISCNKISSFDRNN